MGDLLTLARDVETSRRLRIVRRRYELSASGVDDGLLGFSGSPWLQNAYPQGPGLRIPTIFPLFAADDGPSTRPRFLFCLATRVLRNRTILRGIRQGLTIGVDANHNLGGGASDLPERPIELDVTTPSFRFVDGNVSWHLVIEKNARLTNSGNNGNPRPLTNASNWIYLHADGPAMLYQSFTNSVVAPGTGAPIIYTRGLTAYRPPDLTVNWSALDADLLSFYDIRYPWKNASTPAVNLDIEIAAHGRVSLYASVLQTNPNKRTSTTIAATGNPPEEAFIAAYTAAVGDIGTDGPTYWRVFGSLIFEDLV